MTGAHLARIGARQAEAFGAELLILRGVVGGHHREDGCQEVVLSTGERLCARALIIATGVDWRKLEVDGVEDFLGRGIFFGAGRSEAPLLDGRNVVVVGAGNSAGQAALNLAEHAERVTMLCRGPELAASLSDYLIKRIEVTPRIDVRMRSQVTAVAGNGRLEAVTINGDETLPTDAMFLAMGGVPRTKSAAKRNLLTDPAGYFLTGHDLLDDDRFASMWPLERPPLALESSVPGIFVAGDVRCGSTKRVAGAVGEGAMAVALIHQYLEERT
jgi:thioredoxin reductase (NADPH)